jgi:thiamine-phosphate pyrophosphorylase
MMEKQMYAAVDANINRALEGLRVCEDIMRFCMRRTDFSTRCKEMRHRLADAARCFSPSRLLYGRDVEADAQKFVDLQGELSRNSLADMFSANLHRATEAVRSLEEFGKLAGAGGNAFQVIRFELYALEKDALPALLRRNVTARFSRSLYAIIESAFVPAGAYTDTAVKMIRGGAAVIQLGMNVTSKKVFLKTAREITARCRQSNVLCIINDHVDIAVLSGADGVYLGLNDLNVRDVRSIVPPEMIIGQMILTSEEAGRAEKDGADYFTVGPVYKTVYHTNTGSMELRGSGISIITRTRGMTDLPIVAIGGMIPETAGDTVNAGADSLAVMSYLFKDGNVEENCRVMAAAIRSAGRDTMK